MSIRVPRNNQQIVLNNIVEDKMTHTKGKLCSGTPTVTQAQYVTHQRARRRMSLCSCKVRTCTHAVHALQVKVRISACTSAARSCTACLDKGRTPTQPTCILLFDSGTHLSLIRSLECTAAMLLVATQSRPRQSIARAYCVMFVLPP